MSITVNSDYLSNKNVTVMGLGLHGGGVAAARYACSRGARVTVTDLRSEEILAPSVKDLNGLDIRFVLGEHREDDFINSDIIIKNPGVPRKAALLQLARNHGAVIETDISLFFKDLSDLEIQLGKNLIRLVAVTGTKGKSSTVSAIHHCLAHETEFSYLGGNITISPLNFVEKIYQDARDIVAGRVSQKQVNVVLELSSFQIGDLLLTPALEDGQIDDQIQLYMPDVTVLTNMMHDHQDYYPDMESYVSDKALLFRMCRGINIMGNAGAWVRAFESAAGASGTSIKSTEYPQLVSDPRVRECLPQRPLVPGEHQKSNLALAAQALLELGLDAGQIKAGLSDFPGVEHRLQFLGKLRTSSAEGEFEHRVFNDSAATIPEAAEEAVRAFDQPVYLICGGSDKGLDLSPLQNAMMNAKSSFLLAGSASDRLLKEQGGEAIVNSDIAFAGMEPAIDAAIRELSTAREESVLLLSPGCASFGLFKNEFDRGNQFVSAVKRLEGFISL